MATTEAVLNRRENRRAAKALLRRPVVAVPNVAPPETELTPAELARIHQQLLPIVPTTAWADDICELLKRRRPNGKRLVAYTITDSGKLRTKIQTLLAMIRSAGIFPPPADDVESCTIRTRSHHLGSEMQACWCRECAGTKLWPANYIVDGWISYTCWSNRMRAADDIPIDRVTIGDVCERVLYDDRAWRHDPVYLLWKVEEEPGDVVKLLRKHKWSIVTGTRNVRLLEVGLSTVGLVDDFLRMGHDLASVVGDAAGDVVERLRRYPKDPRAVGTRVIWQRTSTRKMRR